MTPTPKEILVDDRRRTRLARVGRKQDHRYLVEEFEDGSLLLVPAVTVSALELAALRDSPLRESLEKARTGDRRELRYRESFAKYADDQE